MQRVLCCCGRNNDRALSNFIPLKCSSGVMNGYVMKVTPQVTVLFNSIMCMWQLEEQPTTWAEDTNSVNHWMPFGCDYLLNFLPKDFWNHKSMSGRISPATSTALRRTHTYNSKYCFSTTSHVIHKLNQKNNDVCSYN